MSCCEHPSFVNDGGSTVSVSTGTKDPPSRTELAVQISQPRPLTDVLYSLAPNKSPATGKLLGMFLVAILCSKAKQAIKDTYVYAYCLFGSYYQIQIPNEARPLPRNIFLFLVYCTFLRESIYHSKMQAQKEEQM